MTLPYLSLCGLIGALWIATGSGAIAQRVLGSAVIGGMIAASALAIFLIPVAFYAIEHLFPAGNPHASKKLQSAHWVPQLPCNET